LRNLLAPVQSSDGRVSSLRTSSHSRDRKAGGFARRAVGLAASKVHC
jgi:hypothetical protein